MLINKFFLKILIETFNLDGFILIKENNKYNLLHYKIYIKILNFRNNYNSIL